MSDDKDPMTPADFRDLFPTARPARLQRVINDQAARIRLLEQQLKTAREALEAMEGAYIDLMVVGRERIIALGGDCDPIGKMKKADPALIAVRAVIRSLGEKG